MLPVSVLRMSAQNTIPTVVSNFPLPSRSTRRLVAYLLYYITKRKVNMREHDDLAPGLRWAEISTRLSPKITRTHDRCDCTCLKRKRSCSFVIEYVFINPSRYIRRRPDGCRQIEPGCRSHCLWLRRGNGTELGETEGGIFVQVGLYYRL